ncbi:hypothetical protein BT96DRAFT_942448 [Gymnopus androsaceus JB14]|uniref:Uncharacterized protein n=1 Tax=Gymnopus androsaceus JB14 TaxID=1447944 RepID=A0A6A4HAX5_9AGAR|nr:hypothetical protein BT96DRAFT_942448 [Gymnopus androsaceus JB14]
MTPIPGVSVEAISYEAGMEVKGEKALMESGWRLQSEDDFPKDLAQFSIANALFAALTESHVCENSAHRNAMDNASQNAGDMISSLTMQYLNVVDRPLLPTNL